MDFDDFWRDYESQKRDDPDKEFFTTRWEKREAKEAAEQAWNSAIAALERKVANSSISNKEKVLSLTDDMNT